MARDLDLNLARGDSAGTNAVRIPQLTQQRTVDRLPNSPRMQAPEISNDIGRALSRAGGALEDASRAAAYGENADLRIQEMQVQQEKEKQTLAAAKAVSESSLSLLTHFEQLQQTAKPGAPGFTSQLTNDIDAHIEAATKDATPFYKEAYESRMLGFRQSLLAKAQAYQFDEGLKLEVDNVNKGVEAAQKLVYADPSQLEDQLGQWGSTIDANTRFNPEAKRQLKESVRKQLVWAAGAKQIEANPVEWNALLNPYSPRNNPGAVSAAGAGGTSSATQTRLPAVNATVRSYAPIAQAAATESGVDSNILLAQIQAESAGRRDAVSSAGASGVSQFIPETAKRYGVDVTSPESSIKGQAAYMADLLKMFGGDYQKALAGYNWGEGNVQKSITKYGAGWLDHAPQETQNYVAKVSKLAGMQEGDAQVMVNTIDGTPVMPPVTGREKIGETWFDLATFDEQQKFRQYAETKFNEFQTAANQQRQNLATGLELETRNITEMVQRGVAPQGQPKTLADFQAAYQQPERAAQAYAAYSTAWDAATTTSRFNSLPSAQLANVVTEAAPAANDPDFAVKSNFQQIRQQAAVQIMAARQKDPWAYAQTTNDFNPGIADPSKPDFADVVKRRAAALPMMMEKYALSTPSVLSTAEATNLANRMAFLPADDRIATLKSLRSSIADDGVYASLLNTLRPDSPVTVLAGNIAAVGGDVKVGSEVVSTDKIASRIARGEDLLNPSKGEKKTDGGRGSAFPMPKETDMQLAWNDAVGNAYAGFPDAESHAYQAYRAYYAARAAEKGIYDGTPNQNIQSEAITAATGGVGKIDPNGLGNSYKLVLPYGMPADVFKDKAAALWSRIGPENGYARTSIDDLRLRPTGENGRYLVTGPDQLAIPGKDNKPIVLDFLAPNVRLSQQEQSGKIKRAQ